MTEQPTNGQRYGGFWIRVLASILDGLIIGIPATILQLGLGALTGVTSLMYLITAAVLVLTIYLEGTKGGTPGKLILGLRIVNEQNNVIGIPKAILRAVGKIISGMILGIGYLMIAFTDKKRGLHDMIAGTYVIRTK